MFSFSQLLRICLTSIKVEMMAHKKWHTTPFRLGSLNLFFTPRKTPFATVHKINLKSSQTTECLRSWDLPSGTLDSNDASNTLSSYKGMILSDYWDLSVTWYSLCG